MIWFIVDFMPNFISADEYDLTDYDQICLKST